MKSIRIHAKIMDAEIDDDKRGKPQRWESKELYNNMKSSRGLQIGQLLGKTYNRELK